MKRVRPKQLSDMLKKAEKQGCTVEFTNGGHIKITTPNGPVFTASTGGDTRGWKNARALLRKKGLDL